MVNKTVKEGVEIITQIYYNMMMVNSIIHNSSIAVSMYF